LTRALPIAAFYDSNTNTIKSDYSRTLSERLQDGKVAVIIPNAYTGVRFINSPFGSYPAYTALISAVNSVMQDRVIYRPIGPLYPTLAVSLLLIFLLPLITTRIAGVVCISTVTATGIGSLVAVRAGNWILPVVSFNVVLLLSVSTKAAIWAIRSWLTRMAMERDLELGRSVQKTLLPQIKQGENGNVSFKFHYQPYGAMSGDWFQFYLASSPEDELQAVFAIGDVVGKGPSAALATAAIATIWKIHEIRWAKGLFDLDDFLSELDDALSANFRGTQNSTISLAVINLDKVTFITCGAPAWKGVDASNEKLVIRIRPNNPLGVGGSEKRFNRVEWMRDREAVIVGFTDGAIDGIRASRKFEADMLEKKLLEREDCLDATIASVLEHGKGSALPDDITVLVLKLKKSQKLAKNFLRAE